ncbi:MAG: hypothetical protein KIH08_16150, partial [Candidatus Freyarchaeota archaeon]|nr:hypothetical protein [Candidatus Jordarchaeia archaeon]
MRASRCTSPHHSSSLEEVFHTVNALFAGIFKRSYFRRVFYIYLMCSLSVNDLELMEVDVEDI